MKDVYEMLHVESIACTCTILREGNLNNILIDYIVHKSWLTF